jgi:hypothetical protein
MLCSVDVLALAGLGGKCGAACAATARTAARAPAKAAARAKAAAGSPAKSSKKPPAESPARCCAFSFLTSTCVQAAWAAPHFSRADAC